jgi:voltage-gated potassium channel
MSPSESRSIGPLDKSSSKDFELWRRTSIRRIGFGLGAIVAVIGFGIFGYVVRGWTPFEALYMVIITISGVGFTEVHEPATVGARVHTMMVIAFGSVSVAYTVAGFLQLFTEGEIRNFLGRQRMKHQIEALTGHSIIVGYGRVGTLVCDEVAAGGGPFVIIERSADRIPEIERRGFLFLQGDATEEETLHEAGLHRAKTLVSVVPNDAENVFLTLTARRLAPKVEIIARAEQPGTLKTLRHAGANHVVMPAAIGAHRIVSLLNNPSAVEFAELVTRNSRLEIEMEEIPVRPRGPLEGLTLRDLDIGRRTGVIVIAVKRGDGRVEFPASSDEPFIAGDVAVLLGRRSNLDKFRHSFEA